MRWIVRGARPWRARRPGACREQRLFRAGRRRRVGWFQRERGVLRSMRSCFLFVKGLEAWTEKRKGGEGEGGTNL
jgi:hypothetical protein